MTGGASDSVQSGTAGYYAFSAAANGGAYTVTPGKDPVIPGSYGINTVDAIAVQRHLLGVAFLSATD